MSLEAKGKVLKSEIFSNGYSIKEFSEKVNISRTYMSSVVNNKKGVSPQSAKSIANLLNCNISDLFKVTDEKGN